MALASMLHRHSVSRPEPQCGPGVPDRSPLTLRVQVIATAFKLDRICSANYERFLNIQISDFVIVGLENNRNLTFKNCQKPERPCLRVVISSDLHLRPSLDVDEDVIGEGSNLDGGEITAKEEDVDFSGDYLHNGQLPDDGEALFGGAASTGRSTPQSVFSLEVDGLEIVSEPHTRSGSLEPHSTRGSVSPSFSFLSID